MSDEAKAGIIRGFTGDDRLCVKILDDKEFQFYTITYNDVVYTITFHQRYWRCNDFWYPVHGDGADRMMSDIQRDLGLSAAEMQELDQAIADLMIAEG